MISIESFKRFRGIDFVAIIILSVILAVLNRGINLIPNSQLSFILTLISFGFFLTFTALLVRKAGAVTLFYALVAIQTTAVHNLGILGWLKLPVLIIAGIIFELVFLTLKIEIKNIPADVVLGAALSNASIPVTAGLLLSISAIRSLLPNFINLILLAFILGLAGSIVAFLVWWNLKTTKIVMRFEYTN